MMIADILKGKSKNEIENSIALFSKVTQFEILFKYYYNKEKNLDGDKIQNLIKTCGLHVSVDKYESFTEYGLLIKHNIHVTDRKEDPFAMESWEELTLVVSQNGIYTQDHRKGRLR